MRIASLLPSATEIVYALGLEDDLVAVTFECDEPARARGDKHVVVGGLDTSRMTPAAIDSYVRDRLARGADLYTLHADALDALAPELILTQDLCRVCAVPTGHVREALEHLGTRADVLALDPYTLDQVFDTIVDVGEATGTIDRARRLVHGLRARLEAVRQSVKGRARPRTAIVEWVDPPFGCGHWMPDMIEIAGGTPVAAHPGGRSAPTDWAAIRSERPELVVVAPCGFGLAGAVEQAAVVAAELPGCEIWALDGDAVVVRPGPRLVDGVEQLARILHPQLGRPDPRVAQKIRSRSAAPERQPSPQSSPGADQTPTQGATRA